MTTELVKSVSIENLVNQRAAVHERITRAVDLLLEASKIARVAHLGMPRFTVSNGYGNSISDRTICDALVSPVRDGTTMAREASDRLELEKVITSGIDGAGWQYLMHESGMRTFMDAEARKKWDSAIYQGDIPALNAANVRSTFDMLHNSRGEIFERGVVSCFKSLSWQYKTNLPQKFGKRIVLTYLRNSVTGGKWGSSGSLGHPNYEKCNRLDDLTRVMCVLDGKPEPDHRSGWYGLVNRCAKVSDPDPADDYITIKNYRNGNGHATFLRPDLVDKMNAIIAKHYPGALPAPK